MDDDLVEIGFIREAHGLRGQVVVHAHSGRPESLEDYGPLQNTDGSRRFRLTVGQAKNNDFLCRIDGVDDRNAAEALRGMKLFLPAADLPPPDEGEYYIRDLIGLSVRDASGTALGTVRDMFSLGDSHSFDIEFVHDGQHPLPAPQRELLHFTPQNILKVDLAARSVTVAVPHGLLDIVEKPR